VGFLNRNAFLKGRFRKENSLIKVNMEFIEIYFCNIIITNNGS